MRRWEVTVAGAVGVALGGLSTLDDLLDLLPPTLPSPVAGILDRCDHLVVSGVTAAEVPAAWHRLWDVLVATIGHYPTDVGDDGTEVPDVAFVAGRAPLRTAERELLVAAAAGTAAAEALAEQLGSGDTAPPATLARLVRTVAVSAWLAGWSPTATVQAVSDAAAAADDH